MEDKSNFLTLSIVAIVAIIALVVLVTGVQNRVMPASELVFDDASGQAARFTTSAGRGSSPGVSITPRITSIPTITTSRPTSGSGGLVTPYSPLDTAGFPWEYGYIGFWDQEQSDGAKTAVSVDVTDPQTGETGTLVFVFNVGATSPGGSITGLSIADMTGMAVGPATQCNQDASKQVSWSFWTDESGRKVWLVFPFMGLTEQQVRDRCPGATIGQYPDSTGSAPYAHAVRSDGAFKACFKSQTKYKKAEKKAIEELTEGCEGSQQTGGAMAQTQAEANGQQNRVSICENPGVMTADLCPAECPPVKSLTITGIDATSGVATTGTDNDGDKTFSCNVIASGVCSYRCKEIQEEVPGDK
ncbi:hypothetical protein J4410_05405 [Candidatus Woesearchaeota archaeon]|nr:hypothetical protein [Candidatus Woesearchaeota archaeon]